MLEERVLKGLIKWIDQSASTVFFGGAGVSTESGVADFRGTTGLYTGLSGAETYLSIDFMNRNPEAFYEFYRTYFMLTGIRPNPAHETLAFLEAYGKLSAVITQNIDGLHQLAGSREVLELHGNGRRFYCQACGRPYPLEEVAAREGACYCQSPGCGGLVRPDIVLYGEALDGQVIEKAIRALERAELVLVGGSSLTVYPAAGLLHYRKTGSKLALINLEPTSMDDLADLVIREPIGSLFARIQSAFN